MILKTILTTIIVEILTTLRYRLPKFIRGMKVPDSVSENVLKRYQ